MKRINGFFIAFLIILFNLIFVYSVIGYIAESPMWLFAGRDPGSEGEPHAGTVDYDSTVNSEEAKNSHDEENGIENNKADNKAVSLFNFGLFNNKAAINDKEEKAVSELLDNDTLLSFAGISGIDVLSCFKDISAVDRITAFALINKIGIENIEKIIEYLQNGLSYSELSQIIDIIYENLSKEEIEIMEDIIVRNFRNPELSKP